MKGKDYLSNSLISWSFHNLETMGRLKMTCVFFVLKPHLCERVVQCTNNNNLKKWKLKQWLKTILIWTFLPVFCLIFNFVDLPECWLLVKKAYFILKISSFYKKQISHNSEKWTRKKIPLSYRFLNALSVQFVM